MSLQNIISTGLALFQSIREIESGVAVTTHCLYPGNSSVCVSVRGGPAHYVVMDDGGAIREATLAGAGLGSSLKKYERFAHKQGLLFFNGVVKSPPVPVEAVPAAILLVANTSKELADHIFTTWKGSHKRDFKESVKLLINSQFPSVNVIEAKFSGDSNRIHSFENVIQISGGNRLIIDPVLRDANSINSRVVTHLDLKKAQHPGVQQRIVFDDEKESWQSNELAILQFSGVPVIPFSKMSSSIAKLLQAA
ncbi:hypothetical protein G5B35_02025 [Parapusillimonas sp. SGNA-6]|nr:hypothetical protein [Parapusillimonas sp. SGNA-6]